MPYLGKEPVRGQNRELDDISGSFNGGNTAFTMQVGGVNTAAGSANQVFISVGGVMQNPGTDFTVASSTITFTTPPANGLDFWGLIQGDAVDINTPADGSVTNAKVATGAAIAGSKLADNAVGLAQMAGGTDGNLITYDASGDPAHVATGSSGQVLTSNGAGAAPTFQATSDAGQAHNLIVNGAMKVAQRGTSDTTDAQGFTTVDRWRITWSGLEEEVSKYQEQLTSSDAGPWELGFRNAWKIQNGNQTGGADAGGYINPQYAVEAQDIANSGWDYTSASSYITLSFWVKSSVSQTFYGYLRSMDGTNQAYSFSYSASSTWTKVTKTIPGNSNIQIDNNNDSGLYLFLPTFLGTDRTNAGNTENTWAAYSGSNRTKPSTTTWYTTNDATWHITGVQLEVGDSATTFEHRSFGDELARCQRYYWQETGITFFLYQYSSSHKQIRIQHPVPMRATPTETLTGSGITADSETNQFYSAYAASAYDGANKFYSAVKFEAEI